MTEFIQFPLRDGRVTGTPDRELAQRGRGPFGTPLDSLHSCQPHTDQPSPSPSIQGDRQGRCLYWTRPPGPVSLYHPVKSAATMLQTTESLRQPDSESSLEARLGTADI